MKKGRGSELGKVFDLFLGDSVINFNQNDRTLMVIRKILSFNYYFVCKMGMQTHCVRPSLMI